MDFTGKKLLILAGAGVHNKVVKAAHEMGVHVIVTDYLESSPAKKLADESLMYNIYDVDELVEYCKKNNVDGVVGFCIDPTQRPAQEIAEKLGLPAFGTREQVIALTDKQVFKQMCIDNGVDIIPEYTEADVERGNIAYPVLVKPIDSRGSRGTCICNNKEELLEAIPLAKKESSNGEVIIEKYLTDSQDMTITYVVKNGVPMLMSLGDRFPGRIEDNLTRQNIGVIQPSRYADMYLKNVHPKVVKMIKNLGIQNGPVFMQGFADGDTVRMYDPGIRFPGNEYEQIFVKATGLNPMKSVLSYILGGEIDDYDGQLDGSYNLNGKCAMQYMVNVKEGKIAVFEGLEEIANHPNVVTVQQRYFPGEEVKAAGDIKHRAAEIAILVDRKLESIKEMLAFIQEKLVVEDEDGKNLLISPFVPEYIDNYYDFTYEEK